MPLPQIEDARKLNDSQLAEEILATKRKLFELRLQQATRRLEKPHEFKHTRHRLAQLLTVERERELAEEVNSEAPSQKDPEQPQPASEVTDTLSTPQEEE